MRVRASKRMSISAWPPVPLRVMDLDFYATASRANTILLRTSCWVSMGGTGK